jgi:hypothetical protein
MPFMQRRLRVFQEAVAWVVVVDGALRNCPPQWRWLADQTLRACGSIALNTAEGSADAHRRSADSTGLLERQPRKQMLAYAFFWKLA